MMTIPAGRRFLTLCLCALAGGGSAKTISAQKSKGLYDLSVFRTFNLTFKQANWHQLLLNNKASETYIKGDLTVDSKTFKDVGVRARGATAFSGGRRTGKVPLKISFDVFAPGRKFLGHRATDLNNGYWTPTFMREVLIMRMMRDFVPAPGANFVKLVVNNQHRGVYVNIEPPNKDFVHKWYRDNSGNRYKGRGGFAYRGNSPSSYRTFNPLTSKLKANSYRDLIAATLTTTYRGNQAATEIPKLCNVDEAHKMMAVNAAVANTDAFPAHNYYLYVDPFHNQLEVIPWDTNLSLRSNRVSLTPRYFGHTTQWVRRYQAHLRNIAEYELDWAKVSKWVQTWQKLIDAEVKADPIKLYPYASFLAGVNTTVSGFKGLKPAIVDLRNAILGNLRAPQVALSSPTRAPVSPTPKDTVWFTVKAQSSVGVQSVTLHWRWRGYFRELPMFDDGKHRDGKAGDGVYGIMLPFKSAGVDVEYYFSGEAKNLTVNFLPIFTGHQPFRFRFLEPTRTSVLVHEVLASNTKGLKDERGEHEDWIEIYNPTKGAIDLGGMYLSDDRLNVKKWTFPANIFVQPGFSVLVWADADVGDGPLHANFKLSNKGEGLYLSAKDGAVLDYLEFGDQQDDVSFGRLYDDARTVYVTFPTPTPLSRNGLYSCGVRGVSAADPYTHPLTLKFSGTPRVKQKVTVDLAGAPANQGYVLMVGLKVNSLPLPHLDFTMLLGAPLVTTLGLPGTPTGALTVPFTVPNDPQLDGFQMALQALSSDKGQILASNAVLIQFCK